MRRARAAGCIGAMMLAVVLIAPSAQAETEHLSTTCAMTTILRFRFALVAGENSNAFIKLALKLSNCTGDVVSSATGKGGAAGDLVCTDGTVSGRAIAKAVLFWDTGDRTDFDFTFDFDSGQLQGKVVSGLYKDEAVRVTHFRVTPLKGDCASSPLVRSLLKTNRIGI